MKEVKNKKISGGCNLKDAAIEMGTGKICVNGIKAENQTLKINACIVKEEQSNEAFADSNKTPKDEADYSKVKRSEDIDASEHFVKTVKVTDKRNDHGAKLMEFTGRQN